MRDPGTSASGDPELIHYDVWVIHGVGGREQLQSLGLIEKGKARKGYCLYTARYGIISTSGHNYAGYGKLHFMQLREITNLNPDGLITNTKQQNTN